MNKTFENCTLLDTKTWFEKAVPYPTSKNFHTQLGVHCEEVVEMLTSISTLHPDTTKLLHAAEEAMHAFAEHLKQYDNVVAIHPNDELEFLDALCDQTVTATGVAHMRGYDMVGAMTEVNRSNFSKFSPSGEPIFHPESQKIMKGPNYTKAELAPYLPA